MATTIAVKTQHFTVRFIDFSFRGQIIHAFEWVNNGQ
jgi:hypothetical protein